MLCPVHWKGRGNGTCREPVGALGPWLWSCGQERVHPCPPWDNEPAGLVAVTPACGKEAYITCSLSRADPGGEKLQPGFGGTAGLFPPGGAPFLDQSLLLTRVPTCLALAVAPTVSTKSCPAGTEGVALASQVESGAQVTAWKPRPHPQHHPVILVSSSWGPHAQAHCHRLRGVSGDWLLFPLVTRPQETKRDSVLVQFLFQQKVTLVRDGEKGAPA